MNTTNVRSSSNVSLNIEGFIHVSGLVSAGNMGKPSVLGSSSYTTKFTPDETCMSTVNVG